MFLRSHAASVLLNLAVALSKPGSTLLFQTSSRESQGRPSCCNGPTTPSVAKQQMAQGANLIPQIRSQAGCAVESNA